MSNIRRVTVVIDGNKTELGSTHVVIVDNDRIEEITDLLNEMRVI